MRLDEGKDDDEMKDFLRDFNEETKRLEAAMRESDSGPTMLQEIRDLLIEQNKILTKILKTKEEK